MLWLICSLLILFSFCFHKYSTNGITSSTNRYFNLILIFSSGSMNPQGREMPPPGAPQRGGYGRGYY